MLIAYTALVAGAALLFTLGVIGGILLEQDPDYAGSDIPSKTLRRWMFGVAVVVLLSVPLFAQQ